VPDPLSPNPHDRLQRLGRLTLKELREILRDRRTIVTLVLMPLFMYPVLSVAFQQFLLSHPASTTAPVYALGFRDAREARLLRDVLRHGGISIVDIGDAPISKPVPDSGPVIQADIHPQLEDPLRDYKIDVGLQLLTPNAELEIDPRRDVTLDVEVLYLRSSSAGNAAADFIEEHLAIAGEELLGARLKRLGVTQRPVAVRSIRRGLYDADSTASSGVVSLKSVVPFILILMTVTGAVYPAIDLTAGERERGTLEVLMAAPIPRVGILLAKYVTVLTVAVLTAAANLCTMTITIAVTGLGPDLFGESGLSSGVLASIFALLLLFAAFFSAVLLVITSTARSFKEAQAYLIPLMIISLAPGMLSLIPDVELSGTLLVTPLANIVLLGRDLLDFKAGGLATLVVVVSTLLYAGAAIGLAARIFGAESVLYSTHSGWSDLLHRPSESQDAPTVTAAVVCLALVFPAFYIFHSLTARLGEDINVQLAMGACMTAAVFGGIPLAACRLRHVSIRPAFRVPDSPLAVFGASALVGLSLWTFCHELLVFVQGKELQFDPKLAEAVQKFVDGLRLLSPPAVVLAIAIVPAIFEEAFFRGFLFPAFRTRMTPAVAIVATAVVFGFFHWISSRLPASDRLISSTLTGLVLGWVRWRTGSLLPGILLHALHNSFLILVAYYEPQLAGYGLGTSSEQHLPAAWIAAGVTTSCLGLGALYFATRRPARRTTLTGR
jgi:ABC-2 type transport system permease protein/sodium transport system permease protein